MLNLKNVDQIFLSIGSGTMTDLVRFISYHNRSPFISLPTAPSVDAYASSGSALTIGRFKYHIDLHAPIAIFANLGILCASPRPMIASGFGDMFGKFTAVEDWKLAHLILNEPYDDLIANRSWRAVQDCVRRARILGENWEEDIRVLISALIESGLCMRDAGHSRPASGSEHHLSHFWEMKLLREGRPTIIHGVKVGIATLYASKYYELIKQTDQDHAISLLNKSRKPDPEAEIHTINSVYGQIAGQIKEAQAPPLNMTDETFEQIKTRIITYWGEIQKIAATVPSSIVIKNLLSIVEAPTEPISAGLTLENVIEALAYAHYIRPSFTVIKLCYILGMKIN